MKRVSILGNAAGGKSTVARKISDNFGIPYYEIDKLLWNEDWSRRADKTFFREFRAILKYESWVLDGFAAPGTMEEQLDLSDTIILIDHPYEVHLETMHNRQKNWYDLDIKPAGHPNPVPTDQILGVMKFIENQIMPTVRRLIDEAETTGTKTIRLSSFKEIDDFMASV